MFDITEIVIGKDDLIRVSIQEFTVDPDTDIKTFSGKVYCGNGLNKAQFTKDPDAAIDEAKLKFKDEILADRAHDLEINAIETEVRESINPEDFEIYLNE